MAILVKHTFVSAKSDDIDASVVRASNWNENHVLTMATNKLLGRGTAADGVVEEITLGTNLSLTGTTLNAVLGGGVAAVISPQGRLTLQTVVPVMTTTQSAKTTIYYTPYIGNQIGLYDGSNVVVTTFAELSNVTTASAVGSAGPAAVAASSVYDLFVWSNGGTVTLTRGPAWTNDTTRSAGTALVMVNGLLLNNASITNGPAASRGTYVGTVRSNASSQIDWKFGSANTGTAQAGTLFVWNAYNRVKVASFVGDTTSSWSYNSATWRQINGSVGNQISVVSGLSNDALTARYYAAPNPTSGAFAGIGIGINSTTAPAAAVSSGNAAGTVAVVVGEYSGVPAIGVTAIAALEATVGGTGAIYYGTGGAGGGITGIQQTMTIDFMM